MDFIIYNSPSHNIVFKKKMTWPTFPKIVSNILVLRGHKISKKKIMLYKYRFLFRINLWPSDPELLNKSCASDTLFNNKKKKKTVHKSTDIIKFLL